LLDLGEVIAPTGWVGWSSQKCFVEAKIADRARRGFPIKRLPENLLFFKEFAQLLQTFERVEVRR